MENKETFEEAVKPIMKWLCEKRNPHTTIIVTCTSAEVLQGAEVLNTDEFLID